VPFLKTPDTFISKTATNTIYGSLLKGINNGAGAGKFYQKYSLDAPPRREYRFGL
jgi:hypothetical protein